MGAQEPPGAALISRAIDLFYERMLADESLAPKFDDILMERLRAHQRAFVLAALGGPDLYPGRDMHAAHLGLNITDADFDACVVHLVDALVEAGITEGLVTALVGRLEPLRTQIVVRPAHATRSA